MSEIISKRLTVRVSQRTETILAQRCRQEGIADMDRWMELYLEEKLAILARNVFRHDLELTQLGLRPGEDD